MISAKHAIVYGLLVFCINLKQLVSQENFIKHYLSDRKQRVVIPGAVSDWGFY